MSRNKYPEETINKILDVSYKLFLENGYENTSIQDIINNLGGLTKGAIYHHFKSKEDIMVAVINRLNEKQDHGFLDIVQDTTGITGLEKLQKMFEISSTSQRQNDVFEVAPNLLRNPKLLAMQVKSIFEESASNFILPVIEQGLADGSIETDYPQELAEVILLLVKIWLTPNVYYIDEESMKRRFYLFKELLQGLGMDFLDKQILERMLESCQIYSKKK